MKTRTLPILLLLALLGTAACGEDFEPKSTILYLRVLAIKADNPRLSPGQGTTLSALVVSPSADDVIELEWEVCPFTGSADEGYPCVFPEGMPPGMEEALKGRGATFDMEYMPELVFFVEFFCAQQAEIAEQVPEGVPLPDCDQGYPARVRLTATVAGTDEEVVAVKTLYLMSMSVPAQPNRNPVTQGVVPGEEAPAVATVGEPFPVECQIDTDSIEIFTREDEDEESTEYSVMSWYVRNGELDKDMSFFSLTEPEETGDAVENEVTAEEAGTVTVWCVLRDGRGGIDWASMDIEVQ